MAPSLICSSLSNFFKLLFPVINNISFYCYAMLIKTPIAIFWLVPATFFWLRFCWKLAVSRSQAVNNRLLAPFQKLSAKWSHKNSPENLPYGGILGVHGAWRIWLSTLGPCSFRSCLSPILRLHHPLTFKGVVSKQSVCSSWALNRWNIKN